MRNERLAKMTETRRRLGAAPVAAESTGVEFAVSLQRYGTVVIATDGLLVGRRLAQTLQRNLLRGPDEILEVILTGQFVDDAAVVVGKLA